MLYFFGLRDDGRHLCRFFSFSSYIVIDVDAAGALVMTVVAVIIAVTAVCHSLICVVVVVIVLE